MMIDQAEIVWELRRESKFQGGKVMNELEPRGALRAKIAELEELRAKSTQGKWCLGDVAHADYTEALQSIYPELRNALDFAERERDEANARAAVCLNYMKGVQMFGEEKIDEATFMRLHKSFDADIARGCDWFNDYQNIAVKQLGESISHVKQLREALQGLMDLISRGVLVCNIKDDLDHPWVITQLPLVMALKAADDALEIFTVEDGSL